MLVESCTCAVNIYDIRQIGKYNSFDSLESGELKKKSRPISTYTFVAPNIIYGEIGSDNEG